MPPEESKARQNWNKDGRVVLMYSGNLGIGHDLDTVLHAANCLGGADLRVLFVGEGRMRGRLIALAEELGLDNVDFHPPQPLSALSDSLAAGDIHVISQRAGTEGLIVPSKVYGIMAAGRPAVFIGPDDCEVAQIIRDSGSGVIAACGDSDRVAEALESLIADKPLRDRMGACGGEYYTRYFALRRGVAAIADTLASA
jgi:glycosyltransferase involved in cell wall biosynthesis